MCARAPRGARDHHQRRQLQHLLTSATIPDGLADTLGIESSDCDTIDVCGAHSCGLRSNNTITCWGLNHHGQTDAPPGTFGPVGGSRATVTVAKGGPGPTELGPGQGIPCAANTPTCRYINIELRGFAAGTYTVSCSHDGWGAFGPSTFWTYSITVDATGSASRNGPCFIDFAQLTGNGAYVTVNRTGTGTETVRSNWLK